MNVRKFFSWTAILAVMIVAIACNENTTTPTDPPVQRDHPAGPTENNHRLLSRVASPARIGAADARRGV